MSMNGVGILAAIIIGGLAGWLAEKFMNSQMGLFMNIILGIIGAVVLNFILAPSAWPIPAGSPIWSSASLAPAC